MVDDTVQMTTIRTNRAPELPLVELASGIRIRHRSRDINIASRKAQAIVCYLLLSKTGRETREHLVGMFWSESDEQRARGSLRQVVRELRGAFARIDSDALRVDKNALGIDSARVHVDIWDALQEAENGNVHPMLLESRSAIDGLLREFETVDPSFQVWLNAKRRSLGEQIAQSLELVLVDRARPGIEIERAARALLNLDQTHEVAAREIMRQRSAVGDIGGALSVYKALWDTLEEEYDVEPSQETQELVAKIKLAQPEGQGTPAASETALARVQSYAELSIDDETPSQWAGSRNRASSLAMLSNLMIEVTEFDIGAIASESHYLVKGFRQELLACLIRFREWKVCETDAGAQLGNAHIFKVEASAYQALDTIRLVLTLRDTSTGVFLWSERLALSLESWFELQQKIVRRLATALNVHVSVNRLASIGEGRRHDLAMYDLWLKGQTMVLSFDPKSWHEAANLFSQILQTAPTFSPAYSSLAQLNNSIHLFHFGVFRSQERAGEAITLAQRAVRLDGVDSRAQLCLGWAYVMSNQYDKAGLHYALACELNGNDPWTLISSALGLAFAGDAERSQQLADYALELSLDPSPTHWGYQARIRYLHGDPIGAMEAMKNAAAVPAMLAWRSAVLIELGQTAAAQKSFTDFLNAAESNWYGRSSASPENIVRWFLHSFPLRSKEAWLRLRNHLAQLGAPVLRLEHDISHISQAPNHQTHIPME